MNIKYIFVFVLVLISYSLCGEINNEEKIRSLEYEIKEIEKLIKLQKQKLELLWKQQSLSDGNDISNVPKGVEKVDKIPTNTHVREEVPQNRRNILPPLSKDSFSLNFQYQIREKEDVTAISVLYFAYVGDILVFGTRNGSIGVYTIKGENLANYQPPSEYSLEITEILTGVNLKKPSGEYLITVRYSNGVVRTISLGKQNGQYLFQFEFELSLDNGLRINTTSFESYQSKDGQMIVTSDDEGVLRFFNIEGKLIHSLQTAHKSIIKVVRRMRRLAIVSSEMVSFVELGVDQIKMSEVVCTAGVSAFRNVAFDLFRTTAMIFVSTEKNEIIVFSPLKAASGTECRLSQFVPVETSETSKIIDISAVMNFLYVLTTESLLVYEFSKTPLSVSLNQKLYKLLNSTEEVLSNITNRVIYLRKESVFIAIGNEVNVFESPSPFSGLMANLIWLYPLVALGIVVIGGYRLFSVCNRASKSRTSRLDKKKSM